LVSVIKLAALYHAIIKNFTLTLFGNSFRGPKYGKSNIYTRRSWGISSGYTGPISCNDVNLLSINDICSYVICHNTSIECSYYKGHRQDADVVETINRFDDTGCLFYGLRVQSTVYIISAP
ncbi:hypothetical protein L9F63_019436, partial [Diploptera punctata]